ncbi:uncharacterized protein [Argopecten irradians]|uniref:uncharacterized protein n=1 Tax=Argopecten irradians TaxID=31199 RepID=UPI00371E1059
MFAVSFITHNGDSGGMVFEDCQFRYIDIDLEETSQRNLDTPFESVKPTFNLLRREDGTKQIDIVSLTFRYCDVQFLYRKPEVYEVFYKVTTRETADGCSDGAESLNVTATSRVQEIVLPDLDPNSLYSVCMRIHTSVGNSELSDVRWRKPLASLDADEVMPIILVVLVALICVAVLLVVIWCIRHNYKAIDVRVQLPTVDKYSAGDQSEAESQSLIPCSDSGIEEKRNDTIIISRNNSIVKTRRPLPAPRLLHQPPQEPVPTVALYPIV